MVVAVGHMIKAGFKKGATWGTAVALAGNDGLELLNENVTTTIDQIEDMSLVAKPWQKQNLQGAERVQGPIEQYLKYEGLDVLIAMAMGTAGAPTQQAEPTAYKHTWKLKDDLTGLFGAFAVDKQVNIQEVDSAKVNEMVLSGNAGEIVTVQHGLIGRAFSNDSTVNAASSGWTVPANREFVLFSHGVFRMNAQSGAALAAGDIFYPSAFTVTLNNALVGDVLAMSTATTPPLIVEPVRDGFGQVTGSFTFPRLEAEARQDWFLAGTLLKCDIVFTGSVIGGASSNKIEVYLPQIQVVENPDGNVAGPGKLTQTLTWKGTLAGTAPAGMTGITNPIELVVTNKRTSDALA